MDDLGGTGGGDGERGNGWSLPRLGSRRKTRGGGPPNRYGKKRQRTAADILAGCIGGGGRGYFRHRDGDKKEDDNDDGREMGGSSYNASTRSGSSSGSPRISVRKRSMGTAASVALKKKSRSGLRSWSVSRSRHRIPWGEQSGRSKDGRRCRCDDNDCDNNDNGNIGEYGEYIDDGGGGRRGSGNCNGNVRSVESGMRRGW